MGCVLRGGVLLLTRTSPSSSLLHPEDIENKFKTASRFDFLNDHEDPETWHSNVDGKGFDEETKGETKGDDGDDGGGAKDYKGRTLPDKDITFVANKGKPIDVDALNDEFEEMYDGLDDDLKINFGSEESDSDAGSSGGEDMGQAVFWPGDLEDEETAIGRKIEEDKLEASDQYKPVSAGYRLFGGVKRWFF